MKTAVICSGGLDSVVLTHLYSASLQRMITFDYGQRHVKEIKFAKYWAEHFKVPHHIIDLTSLAPHLNSGLLDINSTIPQGEYNEDTIGITEVPNRNIIMISIAAGIAASYGDEEVAIGVHSNNTTTYKDCRPNTLESMRATTQISCGIHLSYPFIDWNKTDIVVAGMRMRVDFDKTWSCYVGGEEHCGECATCLERTEALINAAIY